MKTSYPNSVSRPSSLLFSFLCVGTILLTGISSFAQSNFDVLHYSETSGYDHNTRANSLAMLQALGVANGFAVDDDQTGALFDNLATLQQYEVVVFSNTSGDNILDANQRSNFEAYIASGGSYVGIHAASDTYRHSTANGGNTGTWDFYAELVGASVQSSPNHVSGQPNYTMDKIGTHPVTTNVPDPWNKDEEYYYWENGYFDPANNIVLEVEETIGPNGQVNSYDEARPTSWYRELSSGGRSFYTSLGHANSNFTSDQDFKNLIRDAIKWAVFEVVTVDPLPQQDPYLGIIQNIPGTIESEWYDEGGQGLAYNDDGAHQGSSFRDSENVDVVDKPNASNAMAVGYTDADEWTEYTVDVSGGTYDISLSYASNSSSAGDVLVQLNGVEIALFTGIPSTGSWQTFDTVTMSDVILAEMNEAILRIQLVGAGNLDHDALIFTAETAPEPLSLSSSLIMGELEQYHKTTVQWQGPTLSETASTFTDYRLDVDFTAPDGSVYSVPGYFAADGNAKETSANTGNIWHCHFLPEQVGTYSYAATLRSGVNIALATDLSTADETVTETGSFMVGATSKTGNDFRAKGKLSYIGESHLQFSNGEYFLKVGANTPEVFLETSDFDNTPTSLSFPDHVQDWTSADPSWQSGKGKGIVGVVNYLSGLGMNAHYFLTMNAYGDGDASYPWIGKDDIYIYDISKLDQWQVVFDHMMSKGMMCNFVMTETENESYFETLEGVVGGFADSRKIYFREMVARFGYLNASTWNIGEENGWSAGGTYGAGNSTQQRKDFADYLRTLLPYQDNVTIHNGPSNNDEIYDDLVGLNHYTGISYQGNLGNDLYGHDKIRDWVELSKQLSMPWVVSYDEPYVSSGTYPLDSFRKNSLWAAFTAGASGVESYIGGTDQSLQDYRLYEDIWLCLARAQSFFIDEHIPFYSMSNLDASVDSNAWCLGDDDEYYVVYLKDNGTTNIQLSQGGEYTVKWFDPRNGGALMDGSVAILQGPAEVSIGNAPTTDGTHDWVALIRKVSNADCPHDIDGSGLVEINDFLALNSAFGISCAGCPEDINMDGTVDIDDFLEFNSFFGSSCP